VLGGVAPYLSVSNADKAAGFYMKAFGASEVMRVPPDEKGRYLHIHLVINGGSVMLADAFPDHGHPLETPGAFMLHLQVDDVDAWWKRAVEAGGEVLLPVSEMFWGDRYGQLAIRRRQWSSPRHQEERPRAPCLWTGRVLSAITVLFLPSTAPSSCADPACPASLRNSAVRSALFAPLPGHRDLSAALYACRAPPCVGCWPASWAAHRQPSPA
jgi:uncharacterized glyoxalase superfamily protein PhnB